MQSAIYLEDKVVANVFLKNAWVVKIHLVFKYTQQCYCGVYAMI